MNKNIIKTFLVVILAIVVVFISALPAFSLGHEVTDDGSVMVRTDVESTIYAQGHYWLFYHNFFKVSDDGEVWGNETTILNSGATIDEDHPIDTDTDGTNVYLSAVGFNDGEAAAMFRKGLLNGGNHTITWAADWQTVGTDGSGLGMFASSSVAVDGSGHYWVGYVLYVGGATNHTFLWVHGSSATDGNWTDDPDKETSVNYVGFYGGSSQVVGLDDTCAWVYAGDGYGGYIYGRIYDIFGDEWGAASHSTSRTTEYHDAYQGYTAGFDATYEVDYNYVDIAFLKKDTYDLMFVRMSAVSGAFGTEEVMSWGGSSLSTSIPQVTIDLSTHDLYYWYVYSAALDWFYYMHYIRAESEWQGWNVTDIQPDGFLGNYYYNVMGPTEINNLGITWMTESSHIDFVLPFGNDTCWGYTTDVDNISYTTASFHAHTVSDGCGNCTLSFEYTGGGDDLEIEIGPVESGEDSEGNVTGLHSDTDYTVWAVWTNSCGDYWSAPFYFTTLTPSAPEPPTVSTRPVTEITSVSARLNGLLEYDGGYQCAVGFQYRLHDAAEWQPDAWLSGLWSTGQLFSGVLSNLAPHTSYDVRAVARNALGTSYGNITTFETTLGGGGGPTPTATTPPWLPPQIGELFEWIGGMGSMIKLLLALIITIGLMIMVALKTKRSRANNILVVAVGVACVIGFTVYGWYPSYVIILLAGVIGIGLLLTVMRGGQHA